MLVRTDLSPNAVSSRYDPAMRHMANMSPSNSRRQLIVSDLLVAEELIARAELPPRGDICSRKLVITFAGAFEFQVGRSLTWVDPSRLLFTNPGESYVDHHVAPGVGHSSVILTPDESIVDELWGKSFPTSSRRIRAGSSRVQMLAQYLRRGVGPLAAEELGVAILAESVAEKRRIAELDPGCVRRAKAAIQDRVGGRSSLTEIASELGVTPVHLTQSFKQSEGIPLYRYQKLLRLRRALTRLPEQDDITDLAFELGFSSHSHFTAAFRSEFGITPSQFRSETRSHSARLA